MPIYEYQCLVCQKTTEAMQKFSDAPLTTCPECGGQLKKLVSNSSFVLKGTGWYKTDYAGKDTMKDKKASESKDEQKTADTKTEPKAESAKEAKPEAKKETVSAS